MAFNNKIIIGALAAAAIIASTAGAFAATAYATTNVNVRSGPSTQYRVVDTLRRGERVDIQYCRGSWCQVEKRGRDGWVSANYLDRGYQRPQPPRRPRPIPVPPSWDDDYGWDRPGYQDYPDWRRPHRHHRPNWSHRRPTEPSRAQACFTGPNGYFCVGN